MSLLSKVTRRLRREAGPRVVSPVDLSDRPVARGVAQDYLLYRNEELPDLPVLSFPPSVPANRLSTGPDELVLGVARGTEAKVYPISTLQWHHIVNDELDGAPLTVAFCRKCFSGVALDPVVDDQALTFQVFGLYLGSMVMSDQQTGTVWAPFTGEALAGPLAGRRMRLEAVEMTTLPRWLERYPGSLVPDPAVMVTPDPLRPGQSEHARALRRSVPRWDPRLEARTIVLGVTVGRSSRAYVMDSERPGPPVFEDELAGTPLVLLAGRGAWPLAFERRVAGRTLAFTVEGDRVVDEGGSEWDGGNAVAGPMAGKSLDFLPSHLSEWYAWAAYHPDTDIVRP